MSLQYLLRSGKIAKLLPYPMIKQKSDKIFAPQKQEAALFVYRSMQLLIHRSRNVPQDN